MRRPLTLAVLATTLAASAGATAPAPAVAPVVAGTECLQLRPLGDASRGPRGGEWGGAQGVDATVLPQKMEIDYVRVYNMIEK